MVDSTEDAAGDPGDGEGSRREQRSRLSRRSFVGRGSIGVAVAGVLASVPGLPSWLASSSPEVSGAAGDANVAASEGSGAGQAIMAQVNNVSTGDISLHINGATHVLRDPQLARNIARAVP
ncbi:MAG: twin-arginine translocation signal domain-containing protein [Actinomycetota bacterium]|nr:twin-arginine translocation signal domain-containing protein [Actinomycetota bacterium]